jgi:hypothetical protein
MPGGRCSRVRRGHGDQAQVREGLELQPGQEHDRTVAQLEQQAEVVDQLLPAGPVRDAQHQRLVPGELVILRRRETEGDDAQTCQHEQAGEDGDN